MKAMIVLVFVMGICLGVLGHAIYVFDDHPTINLGDCVFKYHGSAPIEDGRPPHSYYCKVPLDTTR